MIRTVSKMAMVQGNIWSFSRTPLSFPTSLSRRRGQDLAAGVTCPNKVKPFLLTKLGNISMDCVP